jgi:fatty-acyl-CoA synthase
MESVFELVTQLLQHSDKNVILTEDKTITYGELIERSCKLAHGLQNYVEPGERIAVLVPNSMDWIVIELAAGLIGAIVVPINMRYKSHEVTYILQNSKSKMFLFQPYLEKYDYVPLVEQILSQEENDDFPYLKYIVSTSNIQANSKFPSMFLDDLYDHKDGNISDFENLSAPQSVFNILYTSGTTSKPKGVMITQKAAVYHSFNAGRHIGLESSDVVLGALPFCGIFGFNTLYSALALGASIVPMERFKPLEALQLIEKYQCTFFNGVDGMFNPMNEIDTSHMNLSSLRVAVVAIFATNNQKLTENVESVFPNIAVVQPYGMTEVGAMVFVGNPKAMFEERILAGGTLVSPEIEVDIIDPDSGKILPPNQEGEIVIGGYNVMKGYFENPEKTKESFTIDGKFKTGDLGVKYDNGSIEYKGRLKEVLRLKGYLVSPKEIEDYVSLMPEIEIAQAIGIMVDLEDKLITFAKLKEGRNLEEKDVIQYCKLKLADYKCPYRVFFINKFPTTAGSNGEKIRREELRRLANDLLAENRMASSS